MEKKRIVFILGSMRKGGAERVISILSRDFAGRGWNTDICTLLFDGVEYELDSSTVVHELSGCGGSRIRRLPYWLKSIRKLVKKENPDVVVSFAARINIITMIACMGLHRKIVVSERNDPSMDGRSRIVDILTEMLYPKASTVVFQTRRAMNYFGEKVRKNGCIIPNPINVAVTSLSPDKNKIVTVGSLKAQKNHMLLLDAFSDVVKKHSELVLTIYGEGSLRDQIQNRANELGIANKVFLPGKSSTVHEDIKDASVFVLSSDYEGLSNALLEAMMMGLPCISTDCAGSDEYIEDGVNGLLTPVGDKKALASAIEKFVENDEFRKKCGEEAKKVSKLVGLDCTLAKWRSAIE